MAYSSKKSLIAAMATSVCLAGGFSSFAATATVLVGSIGTTFTPATTNINAGDQVIWVWGGLNHSTTSDTNGVWDSGVTSSPHSFTNQFNVAGTYPYHCTIHGGPPFNMRGSILVNTLASQPSVSITNPANNAVLAAPANVTIQATASDTGGTVTNVQFLVGTTVLTNQAAPPYSAVTNNLPAGNYNLSVIASDNNGVQSTNSISISVVTPLPLTVNAAQFSSASFQLSFAANAGLSYVIQQSTNLAAPDWIPLLTNTAASNPMVFVDSHATNSPRFYRVGRLPNP